MCRRGYGAHVGEADNGLEAVGLSAILKPDVILMDINMPKMNGLEATPYCCGKVIIVTGSDLSNIEVEAQNAGAIACLSKPVNPFELAVCRREGLSSDVDLQ
jgi:CheY-like chemotaxis protein